MTRLGALLTIALLTLAACEQAGRGVGNAIGLRKAIPELPYSGDRPDAPPLEERGNSVFTDAAFDATGKLLVTLPWFGSSRIQVWDVDTGAIVSGFDGVVPNPGSKNIWMLDSARRRLFARNGKNDGFALFDLMTGATISEIADTDDGAGGRTAPPPAFREPYSVGLIAGGTQALIFKPGAMELWDVAPPATEGGPGPARLAKRVISPFTPQRFFPTCVGGVPGSTYSDKQCWEWSPDRRTLAVAYTPEEPINAPTQHMLIDADELEIERLEVPEPSSRSFTSFAFSPDNR